MNINDLNDYEENVVSQKKSVRFADDEGLSLGKDAHDKISDMLPNRRLKIMKKNNAVLDQHIVATKQSIFNTD